MAIGLGLDNQDPRAPVALIRWQYGQESVAEAIALCDGFKNLTRGTKVIIKPNLVSWVDKYKFAPFGVLTTSVVLEGAIRALRDFGISHITVAEGTALQEEMHSATHVIYERLNYRYLLKKYGVILSDLNQESHIKTRVGPFNLGIAQRILEADFLVNIPVLKTHSATKVSLGFKNLKGCLDQKSKKGCHELVHSIDEYLVHLGANLYPQLVILDGIYALERGPMYIGHAHRRELLLAGRDMFSVDCIAAELMGFEPSMVGHLKGFAKIYGRDTNTDSIQVKPLDPYEFSGKLEYKSQWSEDGQVPQSFARRGIGGIRIPDPGPSMCTGCSKVFPALLTMLLAAYKSKPYNNLEILAGKALSPSGDAKTTYFLGDCNYAFNKKASVNKGIRLKGCPPRIEHVIQVFRAHGIHLEEESNKQYFEHKAAVYESLKYPNSDYYFPQE